MSFVDLRFLGYVFRFCFVVFHFYFFLFIWVSVFSRLFRRVWLFFRFLGRCRFCAGSRFVFVRGGVRFFASGGRAILGRLPMYVCLFL